MHDWQTLDTDALAAAYENMAHIPEGHAYPDRWAAEAAAFRAAHPRAEIDLPYGGHPRERLDLFHPEGTPRGLVVFIHGGYWMRFAKDHWSHLAAGALAHGHAVAMPSYPLAPDATIPAITDAARRAVDAAADSVPGPVRLTGHSAGGHLAARLLMDDAAPACAPRIATCTPIAPVADLRPLARIPLNDTLRLDEATAAAESPALARPRPGIRIAVHVGAAERPGFLWQADALGAAWDAPVRRAEGRHHFDVIDALRDPASRLVADIMA